MIGAVLLGIVAAIAVAVIGVAVSSMYVGWREQKRLAEYERKYQDWLRKNEGRAKEISHDADVVLATSAKMVGIVERAWANRAQAGIPPPDEDPQSRLVRLVRDSVEVSKAAADQTLEAVETRPEEPKKSWWEIYGLKLGVALIGAVALIAATWLGLTGPAPPDCAAYADTLLAVHKQAPSNEAAVTAVTALQWGSMDDECGPPASFIEPLGDPPPPNG